MTSLYSQILTLKWLAGPKCDCIGPWRGDWAGEGQVNSHLIVINASFTCSGVKVNPMQTQTIMSPLDEQLQGWFWTLLKVGIGALVGAKLHKKYYRTIHNEVYAYMLDRMSLGKYYGMLVNKKKAELFEPLHGLTVQKGRPLTVLDLGTGSGTNFKYMPDGTELMCVDPNPCFSRYLIKNSGIGVLWWVCGYTQ